MRVVFFGGKPFSGRCLEYLCSQNSVEIVGVVCRGPEYRGWWPYKEELEISSVVQRLGLKRVHPDEVLSLEIDWVVSVLYWARISKALLEHAIYGGVNLHLAPLPWYRGCNPGSHAILNQETDYGVTLHQMTEKIDEGPIYSRRTWPISKDETAWTLYQKSERYAGELFRDEILHVLRGESKAVPQACFMVPERTVHYYPRTSLKALKRLESGIDPEELLLRARALSFPGQEPAYFQIKNQKVYVTV